MISTNTAKIRKRSGSYLNTKLVSNNIIYVLIASIVFTSSLVVLAPEDKKVILSDILEPLAAAVAAGFSVIVICRQKIDGLMGKAYALLGVGLVLFLVAEIIWSYYEIAIGIENPFPSIADAVWLIGYGPILYYVFIMYRFLGASHSKTHQVLISIAGTLFVIYLAGGISETADFTNRTGIISFLISISYPILDIVLLIPAALIILNPVKGELTSIPWIFFAVVIMSIGDSTFAYSSNISALEGTGWIWNLFFITSYFITGAGLYWHNRFFISNSKEGR